MSLLSLRVWFQDNADDHSPYVKLRCIYFLSGYISHIIYLWIIVQYSIQSKCCGISCQNILFRALTRTVCMCSTCIILFQMLLVHSCFHLEMQTEIQRLGSVYCTCRNEEKGLWMFGESDSVELDWQASCKWPDNSSGFEVWGLFQLLKLAIMARASM